MTKVNQKTAVRQAIFTILEERGVEYELNGPITMADTLQGDDKEKIRAMLFTNFREGKVEFKESFQEKVNDDKELKKYISGLLNNWVRKDKEFNCGKIYQAKNPGSRAGSSNKEVKEMRKLLSVTADVNAKAAIQAAIDEKLAEIKASKNTVEIDISALPESLRHLVTTTTTES